MSVFHLRIELGNDAMSDLNDVAGALQEVSKSLLNDQEEEGFVVDANGNKVGEWEIEDD
jgi:hypothetical protein